MSKKPLVVFILSAAEFAVSAAMSLIFFYMFLIYGLTTRYDPYYPDSMTFILIPLVVIILRAAVFIPDTIFFFKSKRQRTTGLFQHLFGLTTTFAFSVVTFSMMLDTTENLVPLLLAVYYLLTVSFLVKIGLFIPSLILRSKIRNYKAARYNNAQTNDSQNANSCSNEQKSSDNEVIAPLSPFEEYQESTENGKMENDDDLFR